MHNAVDGRSRRWEVKCGEDNVHSSNIICGKKQTNYTTHSLAFAHKTWHQHH